jgi:polar amino acid transport system permease protein
MMSLTYNEKKRLTQAILFVLLIGFVIQDAMTGGSQSWQRVFARLPLLLTGQGGGWPVTGGFLLNVFISIVAMLVASILGTILALGMLAQTAKLRLPAFFVMNFLRNSPWIVLLFAMLYLLPFRMNLFGIQIEFPAAAKAIIGLSLPVAANFAEIVRGAVQSIHAGQWESARSLGYSTGQIYRRVIFPQALRRMIPGWMNLYAMLMIATALATVTGTQEVVTLLRTTLSMESPTTLVYFYVTVLLMFLAYCYPIAWLARRFETSMKGDAL